MIISAIIFGSIISLVLGILSFFVVSRNLEFAGTGISHAVFGGLAIGILLNINPLITATIFSIIFSLLIVESSNKQNENTAIGVLYPFSMAIGIFILSKFSKNYQDIWSYLFGNIFLISKFDFFVFLVYSVVIVFFILFRFKELVLIAFHKELAISNGINVKLYDYLFFIVLSIGIILSVKLLGVILSTAFLVIPSAISFRLFKGIIKNIVFSCLISLSFTALGIVLSYLFDLPVSSTIVIMASTLYLILSLFQLRGKHS
ncbi:MAG: metal ABC transporter permease [candidate division WOR-3 bacterium]|nr:metal ABC transporter permease [candidate division WOR-3 bacterium]MCX7947595.1 metal ABC transporter permease [candidate division WOR-3 bacterium]MDW8150480.1 metal ABC transporter permease [candidate division WOR-3 bacterium]